MDTELQHQCVPVAVHGSYADVQDVGNFLVDFSLDKQLQHFHFPGCDVEFGGIFVQGREPRSSGVLYTKWPF
jgi:hypothetical protein